MEDPTPQPDRPTNSRRSKIVLLFLVLLALVAFGLFRLCHSDYSREVGANGQESQTEYSLDSAKKTSESLDLSKMSTDSTKMSADTAKMSLDTSNMTSDSSKMDISSSLHSGDEGPVRAKTAILGYSYFKEMKRKDTKFVHAIISINNPEGKVRDTLIALNMDDHMETGNDTSSVFTKNMIVFRYVTVSLINASDSAFRIEQIQDSARQLIDSVNGNHWLWSVTPITDENTGVLVLKVIAESPNGRPESFNSHAIPIKIDIQLNIFRRVWNYMVDNPGKVLTLILIPIIAFFGRKLFGKNGRKK